MTFVYLTTDEVNQSLALHMAAECGVTLCPLSPHETLRARAFDGVVYDWDSLPLHRQQEILTELFSGPAPLPVAIHGYNLDEGQTAALRKHGVAVYRCLQPEVFWHLRLASVQTRDACLPHYERDHEPDLKDRLLRRLAELSQGSEGRVIPLEG